MTVDELRKKLDGISGSVEVVIPNAFSSSFWPEFLQVGEARLALFSVTHDGDYIPTEAGDESNCTAFAIQ